jgi:hypothetical protein
MGVKHGCCVDPSICDTMLRGVLDPLTKFPRASWLNWQSVLVQTKKLGGSTCAEKLGIVEARPWIPAQPSRYCSFDALQ